jgi:diguanylate cyclase (GGDEF)-like protein
MESSYRADHQRHIWRLQTLHRVIDLVAAQGDAESSLQLIADEIYRRFQFTSVAIALLDGEWLDFRYIAAAVPVPNNRNHISRGICGRAVRTRQGQLVEDVTLDPDYVHAAGPVTKETCLPIFVDDTVFGVLNVEAAAGNPLGAEEFDVLTTLAHSLGVAIERSRRRVAERRRVDTLARLQQLTGRIAGRVNVTDEVGDLLDEIGRTLDVRVATFGLIRDGQMHVYAAFDDALPHRAPIASHGLDRGISGRVARTGEAAFVRDVTRDPDYLAHAPGVRQEICVPVCIGAEVVGILDFEMDDRRDLDQSDLDVALLLADHLSMALANQRRFEILERRNRQLRTVAQVTAVIAGAARLREAMPDVLRALADGFAFSSCGIALLEGERLNFVAIEHSLTGDTSHFREFGVPITRGITGRVARTGQPAIVLDVRSDPDYLLTSEEVCYEVCVPIKVEGRVAGIVNIEAPAPQPLDDSDAEILAIIADHIGLGLARSDLYVAELQHRRELEALQEVAAIVARTLDTQEALRLIVETLARVFDYPVVSFRLLQGDELVVAAVHGAVAGQQSRPIHVGQGIIGRVAQTGQAAFIPDVDAEPSYVRMRQDLTSEVCVPINVGGQLGGVLNVEGTAERPVTARDLDLLQTFAEHAGTLLHNARLYEQMRLLATRDPITDLPNHRVFRERLHEEVRRAERYDRPLSLLLLDLDDFKAINDELGHQAGDAILRELAARLRAALRDTDLLARYAGDEFVALLPEASPEHTCGTVQRLRQAITRQPFSVPARVEFSIGAACYPADARGEDELIDAADRAMYRDKRARDQARERP